MSELSLFVIMGAVVIVVIFMLLAKLFGGRLKRAKIELSPHRGIFGELETFPSDEKKEGVSQTFGGILYTQDLVPDEQQSPNERKEVTQSPAFMDDNYIVDILARLELEREEGDIVRFYDNTIDNEEGKE